MTILMLIAGAAVLIAGAELLVRGASRLATAAGISPLVVGLTVVAFGTSSPEMAVTVGAAYAGQAQMALGNVVGSNIFNVLFILGLSAVVAPLVVSREIVRRDVPIMIGASLLVLVLALDGAIGRLEGAVLFAGVIAYTVYLIRSARRAGRRSPGEGPGAEESRASVQESAGETAGESGAGTPGQPGQPGEPPASAGRWPMNVGLVIVGLALLVLGARWLVAAAVTIATALGVSELVIGLTIVAAGTSLPEVATSILASLRGERDIAVGNVVGSNLFNLLAVLGLGGLVAPNGVPVPPGALSFDLLVMTGVAVAALPVFFTGFAIARWEGALFLGYYVAYTTYLVLDATDHAALEGFAAAMLGFVMPLTVITIAVVAVRAIRGGGLRAGSTGAGG